MKSRWWIAGWELHHQVDKNDTRDNLTQVCVLKADGRTGPCGQHRGSSVQHLTISVVYNWSCLPFRIQSTLLPGFANSNLSLNRQVPIGTVRFLKSQQQRHFQLSPCCSIEDIVGNKPWFHKHFSKTSYKIIGLYRFSSTNTNEPKWTTQIGISLHIW